MIKKIKTEHLRVGSFIHDLNYSIPGENVYINKTLIKSRKAIDIIHSWGIEEVYIDTDRGLDVDPAALFQVPKCNGTSLRNQVSLRKEVRAARGIKKEAEVLMQKSLEAIHSGKGIDVENAYRVVEKMQESVSRNKDALFLLTRIKKKDEYTLLHSISVSSLVLAFCTANNMDYESTLNMAIGGLFHDIGKTLIPNSILNKPERLNSEEYAIICKHTEHATDILQKTKDLPLEALDIALHHHERCNGSGYPHGLQHDKIQLGAKIAAICDIFDAITSDRCYKKGVDRVTGLKKLYDMAGSEIDRDLTHSFIRFIGVYPVGTLVKLEDQRSGMVVESTGNMLRPLVRVFYTDKENRPLMPEDVDLSEVGLNIAAYETPSRWSDEKKACYRDLKNSMNSLLLH